MMKDSVLMEDRLNIPGKPCEEEIMEKFLSRPTFIRPAPGSVRCSGNRDRM